MEVIRAKNVTTGVLLVGSLLLSVPAWSMDTLTDGQLAETTGQAGVTISIKLPSPSNTLNINQVAVFDGNGFTGQTGVGSLVLGKNANGSAVGSQPTLGNGMSLTAATPINLIVDASGGGASGVTTGVSPVLNIGVLLPTAMTLVTGDIGIAAGVGSAGSYKVGTTGSGDVRIMDSTSMTFNFSGAPRINIQMGYQTQSAAIVLSSLNISSVVFNTPVSLVSPNGGVGASQLNFTPTLTNLDLSGATINIENTAGLQLALPSSGITAGGLLFQQGSATLSGIGLTLDNITAGTSGGAASATVIAPGSTVSTTFASGMTNAPIGSVGAIGMAVTGLKIGISGM